MTDRRVSRIGWGVRCLALALCLLLGGCGLFSFGVSNSPDWCPNPKGSPACL